ncbi:MAG TPA: hypothetical protein VG890_09020 [Puia sp.]|nr:hypothetical protein [Puia sp.]
MKNSISLVVAKLACLFMLLFITNGCMKDRVTRTYQIQTPIYETLTQARTVIKSGVATQLSYPGKITTYKNYIFINESYQGIHIIDNSDPGQPKNIAFLNIPGNTDLSIRNDALYANESYGDLVVFDISDPAHAVARTFVQNVFYNYSNRSPDSTLVVTGYTTKDTTIRFDPDNPPLNYGGCAYCSTTFAPGAAYAAAAPNNNTTGTNGSTSAFAIAGNYLYSLISGYELKVIDISNPDDPAPANTITTGDYYQTIYPFEDKLFLGSSNGMYIYDISDPAAPVKKGTFAHVRTCDPVIADGDNAFVTLRSGTPCVGYTNELEVLDVSNIENPSLLKVYQLTNPRGLSKDGDLLFICDGQDGLKVFNASDVQKVSAIKTLSGFESNDVIAQHGVAVVLAVDGLYQFDYTDTANIHQISKISTQTYAP